MLDVGRWEVRTFLIAEWATVLPDGKLVIAGAGIGGVTVPSLPHPLPNLALVVRVRVPWERLGQPYTITVRALDEDRQPLLPAPLLQGEGAMGRLPAGEEACIQAVLPLVGIVARVAGTAFFHLEMNGEVLSTLPLRVSLPALAA